MITAELHMTGDLASARLGDWICHRARLLNLTGWVEHASDGAATIVITGPEPLIDAMEVACSLGPVEVLVDRIDRRILPRAATANEFTKR